MGPLAPSSQAMMQTWQKARQIFRVKLEEYWTEKSLYVHYLKTAIYRGIVQPEGDRRPPPKCPKPPDIKRYLTAKVSKGVVKRAQELQQVCLCVWEAASSGQAWQVVNQFVR